MNDLNSARIIKILNRLLTVKVELLHSTGKTGKSIAQSACSVRGAGNEVAGSFACTLCIGAAEAVVQTGKKVCGGAGCRTGRAAECFDVAIGKSSIRQSSTCISKFGNGTDRLRRHLRDNVHVDTHARQNIVDDGANAACVDVSKKAVHSVTQRGKAVNNNSQVRDHTY